MLESKYKISEIKSRSFMEEKSKPLLLRLDLIWHGSICECFNLFFADFLYLVCT